MSSVALRGPVVGHEKTLAVLEKMLNGGRLSHALLFCGPKSVGKRTVAQFFAQSLFKRSNAPDNVEVLLRNGTFPDLALVYPEPGKKDISVESVRALRDQIRLKPYYAGCKVGIIDDAERMSQSACNSLLMTLEEPPENTYIILVSSAAHRLPATIVSRCTIVNFSFLSSTEVAQVGKLLGMRAEIPQEALHTLVKTSDGSLALADLDRFIDPQTLALINPADFSEHLSNLSREVKSIEDLLSGLDLNNLSPAQAVALGAQLTQDADQLPFVWLVLRRFVRQQLRASDGPAAHQWAGLLEQLLQSERWVRERNVSAPLHLSNLLLEVGS